MYQGQCVAMKGRPDVLITITKRKAGNPNVYGVKLGSTVHHYTELEIWKHFTRTERVRDDDWPMVFIEDCPEICPYCGRKVGRCGCGWC